MITVGIPGWSAKNKRIPPLKLRCGYHTCTPTHIHAHKQSRGMRESKVGEKEKLAGLPGGQKDYDT